MTEEEQKPELNESKQPAEPIPPAETTPIDGKEVDELEPDEEPELERKGISENKIKIGIALTVIIIVVGVLLWGMVPEEIYDVSKITEDPGKFDGEEINVKGVVMDWDGSDMNFTLADSLDENITIQIMHGGGPPEGFGNNVTIVAMGLFDSAAMTLQTISIQVGCPSKY
jgi:cytochrome c-type biogenesis protein CcmE